MNKVGKPQRGGQYINTTWQKGRHHERNNRLKTFPLPQRNWENEGFYYPNPQPLPLIETGEGEHYSNMKRKSTMYRRCIQRLRPHSPIPRAV